MADHDHRREDMIKWRRLQGRCENGEMENMTEKRGWEDLDMDCLVDVFGRVGMESLFTDIPFVCKSWHKASLHPSCWKNLVFPDNWSSFADKLAERDICQLEGFSISRFIKLIINRSCKSATTLYFPGGCSVESFNYAADGSPGLRSLRLSQSQLFDSTLKLMEVLGKWKSLEYLELDNCFELVDNIGAISLNCKNLSSLRVNYAKINDDQALAIVTLLPNIKHLHLSRACFFQKLENLVRILKGCKELVTLDVTNCSFRGEFEFERLEANEEILKLASGIHTFYSFSFS